MRRWGSVAMVIAVGSLMLGACGEQTAQSPPGATTAPASSAAFQQRAEQVATAWRDGGLIESWTSGFVPLAPLTVEPDWTPHGNLKASWGNGWVRTLIALPTKADSGQIVFADKSTADVPLASAQAAYGSAVPRRYGECPTAEGGGCDWVSVVGAHLGTMQLSTSRGMAIVPAWFFDIEGLPQRLKQVAV